jgi:tripartite ATP-independent transporter DctM subunit
MVVLPLAEIALRRLFAVGIPGSIPFVQHLGLWVAFLGAALAAREGRLLALATGAFLPEGRIRWAAGVFASTVAAFVAVLLFRGALNLVVAEREVGRVIAANVPVWVGQLPFPFAFALITLRLAWRAGPPWAGRAIVALGILAGLWIGQDQDLLAGRSPWPGLVTIVVAAALGAPIFAVLGGAAVLLFLADGIGPVEVLIETYALAVNPTLPSIPLFTLAGFLLAEGRAPERLLGLFRGFVGWMPGGTAIVCVLLSAFFTVFTGGSGVTILALGGLLLPALLKDGYRERFSIGLITASGSLGLLLPLSLPLILYGIVAQTAIENLFIGGILPALLLVGLSAAWGVREGLIAATPHSRFQPREAAAALWAAKWEALLPVVVLIAFLGGYATLVESAALAALYAFVSQTAVHRDISIRKDLGRVVTECAATIGGVLVILGVAVGLTSYLIAADVPGRLLLLTQTYVDSPRVFLLCLNVFLLIVGCLMDIFSATFVVVPLIVPLGLAYGIDPVHLGIIFIANLELGYLTPPVGLNLFLSSYRFKRPLLEVYWASLPMLGILGFGVLVITYVPWLTTGLLALLGR